MKKISLIIPALILLSLVVLLWPKKQACFNNHCFKVEIAKTSTQRSRGLMFRKSLDEDKGMLFVYDKEGEYSFWMKSTLIPLDIIWFNKDKEIVFISKDTQPCIEDECQPIYPNTNAQYVLEINSGLTDKLNMNIGDKLDF